MEIKYGEEPPEEDEGSVQEKTSWFVKWNMAINDKNRHGFFIKRGKRKTVDQGHYERQPLDIEKYLGIVIDGRYIR